MLQKWCVLVFALAIAFVDTSVFPRHETAPTADVLNGTYYGVHNTLYDQDFFLGVSFAPPSVGELRLRIPQPLNTTWAEPRNATEYGPSCLGYNQTTGASEDCLTLNIVRPGGVSPDARLPVLGESRPLRGRAGADFGTSVDLQWRFRWRRISFTSIQLILHRR